MLSWDIDADWQYDPELKTKDIEVRFTSGGEMTPRLSNLSTAVSIATAHVAMRCARIFNSTGDWGRLLQAFAQAAAAKGLSS